MATVSTRDFLNYAMSHQGFLERILNENNGAQRQHQDQIATLEQARREALDELARQYLPALLPESFASIPALTSYRQFELNNPFERMEQRRQSLSARIVAIESDERYIRREQLLDPAAGELTLKFAEAEKQLKFFDDSLAPYEMEPEFLGLIEIGYDTDDYSVNMWDLQYYSDWKYGDMITEKFEQERFRDVRENYLRLKEARTEFNKDLVAIKKQKDAVESLIEERTQALSALETLEVDTLNACRLQLREHLEYIDLPELAKRSAANPDITNNIKRIHGIEKKREYLDELANRYLKTEREQVVNAITKINAKIEKYSRPKHAHGVIPLEEANRWLKDPSEKIGARRRHYYRSYQTISEFDRYHAYDYARDMLWWDLMTDGRIDGDFVPEVHDWREQHPGHTRISESDITGAGTDYPAQSADPIGLENMLDVS